ncbi:MAG: polysaccharide deacetylase family protein [Clostridiales bacterium]|nr:polysaccharide deacetylase family protein [Clostridiales bacterium]
MKKPILFLLLALGLFGLVGCNSSSNQNSTKANSNQESLESPNQEEVKKIVYEIDPTKPIIALTFDDGPNTTTTMRVLDKCEEYGVVASFFVIGNNINENSAEAIKRAYALGCEIDNHSKTHGYLNKMTEDEVKAEIQFTNDKVKELIGIEPKFFRPPYIATSSIMYDSIDMPFICGIGSNDWDAKVSVEDRAGKILDQIKDGSIILLHDSEGNLKTVQALDILIPELKKQGYQFATVSELFEAKGVAIDPEDSMLYSIVG